MCSKIKDSDKTFLLRKQNNKIYISSKPGEKLSDNSLFISKIKLDASLSSLLMFATLHPNKYLNWNQRNTKPELNVTQRP